MTRWLLVIHDQSHSPPSGQQGFTLSVSLFLPSSPPASPPAPFLVLQPLPPWPADTSATLFTAPRSSAFLHTAGFHTVVPCSDVTSDLVFWLNAPPFSHGESPLSHRVQLGTVSHLDNELEQSDVFCQEFGFLTE